MKYYNNNSPKIDYLSTEIKSVTILIVTYK